MYHLLTLVAALIIVVALVRWAVRHADNDDAGQAEPATGKDAK